MNTLEQGVFKRLEQGSERRAEPVAKAEAQPAASQLAAEGIVALDTTNPDTFLGRLGQAISPYTKKAALSASAVLAVIATTYCFNISAYGDKEFSTKSVQVTTADQRPSQESPAIVDELSQRLSHTIYTSEDQNLPPEAKLLHQKDLALAKEIIEGIKLDFLIHEVTTVEVRNHMSTTTERTFSHFMNLVMQRSWVEFYPEGVEMFLNPNFGSEKVGRRNIIHESGHSIDPDSNPYLANFITPSDLLALQKATAKLKDIYWRNYFPDDQKTLSPMEAYYRKMYTSAVGARFGGSEDLGKRLMLAYLQNPQQFKDWSQEDRDFLQKSIQFLGGEFLAENVANFAPDSLKSSQNFPDLTKASFELGAVLDVAVTQHR